MKLPWKKLAEVEQSVDALAEMRAMAKQQANYAMRRLIVLAMKRASGDDEEHEEARQ